ncbi:MAG: hypothetical protein GEV10_31480 [Streptosporangiales bacterium]|nr:hypothetical protein [Streptosporangiales bacterium]
MIDNPAADYAARLPGILAAADAAEQRRHRRASVLELAPEHDAGRWDLGLDDGDMTDEEAIAELDRLGLSVDDAMSLADETLGDVTEFDEDTVRPLGLDHEVEELEADLNAMDLEQREIQRHWREQQRQGRALQVQSPGGPLITAAAAEARDADSHDEADAWIDASRPWNQASDLAREDDLIDRPATRGARAGRHLELAASNPSGHGPLIDADRRLHPQDYAPPGPAGVDTAQAADLQEFIQAVGETNPTVRGASYAPRVPQQFTRLEDTSRGQELEQPHITMDEAAYRDPGWLEAIREQCPELYLRNSG